MDDEVLREAKRDARALVQARLGEDDLELADVLDRCYAPATFRVLVETLIGFAHSMISETASPELDRATVSMLADILAKVLQTFFDGDMAQITDYLSRISDDS